MLKSRKQRETNLPKRRKRRWILPAVLIAAAAAIVILPRLGGKQEQPQLDLLDTTRLIRRDLEDTVAAEGVVESAMSTTVYSTMAYPVMAVHVEVGDYVREGDLLAELDDQTIRNQIASQEIARDTSSQSGAHQVQTAQQNYENFRSGLDQGLNATLNGAQSQVDTAYDNYIRAKNTYERYADSLDLGENTTLLSAESALRGAKSAYDTARDACADTRKACEEAQRGLEAAEEELNRSQLLQEALQIDLDTAEQTLEDLRLRQEAGEPELEQMICEQEQTILSLQTQLLEQSVAIDGVLGMGGLQSAFDSALTLRDQAAAALESAETAMDNAAKTYETQKSTYNAAVTTVDNALADYLTAMETAWETYEKALVSLESTEKTVNEQLQSYANSVTTAQIAAGGASAEESLRQLQATLADTRITAPCSGTVTAVYAQVGGAGSGLLFIIEDVEDLVIAASVKGYDMGQVREGQQVRIRSDATGDREISGVLTSIAPTAEKTAQGYTNTASEASFAAEIAVETRDSGLRIGMEAQLDYILAREIGILAVPYDAVYENEQGQTCILIAQEEGDRCRILELPVTCGLDDDLDMVVSGEGVEEGLLVIHDPDAYLHLVGQSVLTGTGLSSGLPFPMGG